MRVLGLVKLDGGGGENTGKPIRNLRHCHRSDCNIRLRKVRRCDNVKFDSEYLLLNVFRERIVVFLKIFYWPFFGDLQFKRVSIQAYFHRDLQSDLNKRTTCDIKYEIRYKNDFVTTPHVYACTS